MTLPKYLYVKNQDKVTTFSLVGEDSDHYIAKSYIIPSANFHFKKIDKSIIGMGEEPYPLPDGRKIIPVPDKVYMLQNEVLNEVSAKAPNKIQIAGLSLEIRTALNLRS